MGHDGRELPSREKEENGIAQQEELEALEAIYGDDFEVVNPGSAASCTEVRVRVSNIPLVNLHLRLPKGYPSRDFPAHEIRAPGLGQAARIALSQALRPGEEGNENAIGGGKGKGGATVVSPSIDGSVVIFDWAEILRDLLSRTDYPAATSNARDGTKENASVSSSSATDKDPPARAANRTDLLEDIGSWEGHGAGEGREAESGKSSCWAGEELREEEGVEIVHGEAFTDRKSTFQAHLARVSSERQVTWVRNRLLENSKIARATHNIAAWRVWDEARGVQLHDNDDDGESAAGSRLAHMLAITGAQNVLVVVSRWFGGIHLGPDRFKHINNAARELLVRCGATAGTNNVGGSSSVKLEAGGGGKQRTRRRRGSGGGS